MAVRVEIESVEKRFGAVRAVDGVDLRIEPGELFFLLGPSGCGKTTLLRCIAGFYTPDRGAIRIGTEDVTRAPPHARDTGMVFQSYALWPHMTVRENVAFGLQQRRIDRAQIARRVDEALAMVRMADYADRRPNQLSGGQQQRVALARALVIHPKCLLLDEPLSNLDAKLRLEMRGEIRRICKTAGLTAIYVTHDQKEALSIADRITVMDAGRVRQCGAPRDVYLRPVDRFVAHFIGEANFVEAVAESDANGRARFRTPFGRVEVLASGPAPGAPAVLCIRPESVRLAPPPAGAPNVFDAVLHDTVYLGEMAQHRLDLPVPGGGAAVSFKVFELPPGIVARDDRREAVRAWFDPADVTVLPG